jgi:hypothetical protein
MKAHDCATLQMQKTTLQPTAKPKSFEKLLDHDHTRIGGQPLILESDFRNTVDTAKNMCFTYSHLLWPPEKDVFRVVVLSKTISGGYLFVYLFPKDQILCNYKVKSRPCTKSFPGEGMEKWNYRTHLSGNIRTRSLNGDGNTCSRRKTSLPIPDQEHGDGIIFMKALYRGRSRKQYGSQKSRNR